MALKLTVDNLESIPEDLRGYYTEKEGKYHLNVEGVQDTKGLKSALDKERKAHEDLEKQTKAWENSGRNRRDSQGARGC